MSSLAYKALSVGLAGRLRSVVLVVLAVLSGVLGVARSEAAALMDQFADREILTETIGTVTGSNINATVETSEPQHAGKSGGSSVWISWMAPTNGIVTFRTSGSAFDTLLAAYYFRDGDAQTLDKLREAASNDDDPVTAPASYIQFAAKAGRRYEIAVDGYRGASGAVVLSWDFIDINTQPPIVVSVPGDRAVRLGDPVTLTVNFETSPDARLQWRFNGDSFGEEGPTLFIPSLQLTNVGRYSLRVRIGDNRFETTPVEIQVNSEGQTNALARDKFLDALDSRLTPDDHGGGGDGAGPLIVAAAGQAVGASAGVSRGYNGTQIFNTTYATPDPNEPQHCGVAGGASYWFAYEAPTNGTLHVDTIGSGYDTLLAAYGVQVPTTGFDSLVPLACDNDAVALSGESRIQLAVAAGQQYLVVLDGVAGAKGIAHLNYRLEPAPVSDVVPPTLTITAPSAASLTVSSPTILITGTAADNFSVSNILVHTPSATTVALIPGASDWSTTLDLAAGTNTFYFTAFDASGNTSETVGRAIFYKVTSPLTLSVEGGGTVSGASSGQLLDIGRHYVLTAKPARGHVFRNWSGATNAATASLRFVMQSNAALTANFIPNPFESTAGVFHGLFQDSGNVALETSGWLKLSLRSSGAFSGSIRQAHRRLAFSGRFDVEGRARVAVPRAGTNALFLNLHLDLPEGIEVRGSLDFNSLPMDILMRRSVFHPRSNPAANYAGRYTLLLPGAADGDVAPIGDGFSVITISTAGTLSAAGVLADGTAFSQSVPVSRDGDWPLFASLYRGRGVLAGNLRVRPPSDDGTDIEGTARWLRLAGPKPATYTNGFLLASTVVGSSYTNFGSARAFDMDAASLTLTGATGAILATNALSFGPGGRMTNRGPNQLTLKLTAGSGRMRGSITLPDSARATALHGVVLQRQQMAGGNFQRSNTVGRVFLGP